VNEVMRVHASRVRRANRLCETPHDAHSCAWGGGRWSRSWRRRAGVASAFAAGVIVAWGFAPTALANGSQPRFDLADPAGAPFPSDRFTLADDRQLTGLRVDLPKRDCNVGPSVCDDIEILNTLDGFNLQPRLSIPFTAPIDVNTVSGETVLLFKLSDCAGGSFIGINQLVWDPENNALHAESDRFLDQSSR
jgi:hypothetical protein